MPLVGATNKGFKGPLAGIVTPNGVTYVRIMSTAAATRACSQDLRAGRAESRSGPLLRPKWRR